jgi:hypothetical protein
MTRRYGVPECETPRRPGQLIDGVPCSRVEATSLFRVVASREASADG